METWFGLTCAGNIPQLKGVTSKLGGTSRGNKVGVVTIKSFSKDTFEDVR